MFTFDLTSFVLGIVFTEMASVFVVILFLRQPSHKGAKNAQKTTD